MKKWERDVLVGWMVVLIILFAHYLISLSLHRPYFADGSVDRMLWFTSFPAFLIVFGAAFLQKTGTLQLAVRRSFIWTAELIVGYSVIALLFRSFDTLFSHPGVYWLFGAVFFAPLIYLLEFRRQNHYTKASMR